MSPFLLLCLLLESLAAPGCAYLKTSRTAKRSIRLRKFMVPPWAEFLNKTKEDLAFGLVKIDLLSEIRAEVQVLGAIRELEKTVKENAKASKDMQEQNAKALKDMQEQNAKALKDMQVQNAKALKDLEEKIEPLLTIQRFLLPVSGAALLYLAQYLSSHVIYTPPMSLTFVP